MKWCPTLCNSTDSNMPDFPVLHCLSEFAHTRIYWASDAIQLSHPVTPFSSCPQSFPALRYFLMSQLFASGVQHVGTSASVLPMSIQVWFPLGLTGLISLLSKWLSRVFSSTKIQKHRFSSAQPSLWSNWHPYMTPGKALTIWTFVSKVMSLLFSILSKFVIGFLPRSKSLLILWLHSLRL